MQSGSEMKASLLFGPTSIQSFPSLTTGHDFLHSWLHFLGLHLEAFTIAIRVKCSSPPLLVVVPPFFFGGIVVTPFTVDTKKLSSGHFEAAKKKLMREL